jgi:hypothetical protein
MARAAAAKALLTVPGGERVKRVDADAPTRYLAHVRGAIRPHDGEGIAEAAAEFNAAR